MGATLAAVHADATRWRLLAALIGASVGLLAVRNLARVPYDDAYFFKRFALNALRAGELAWNLDEGPVHGATSQLWQALAVGLTAVAPDHYVLAAKLLALLASSSGAYLLVGTCSRYRAAAAALVAVSSPAWLYAALSGMETGLVLALLAGCARLASDHRPARARWLAPAAVLLVYLARPDAAVLALALLLANVSSTREQVLRAGLCAVAVALWLALAKGYYGTALPLPFYAKTSAFSPYDAEFLALCARDKLTHVALFALAAVPLAGLACLRLDRVTALVLAGTAVFVGYHVVLAVDVMGMHARFLLPALVPLALAAARGLEHAAKDDATARKRRARTVAATCLAWLLAGLALWHWPPLGRADRSAPILLAAHVLATAYALAGSAWPRLHARTTRPSAAALLAAALLAPAATRLARFDDGSYLRAHVEQGTVFRGLPQLVACLGDRIHVYHSEAGVPGLIVAHGKVTDLAGLLSADLLFRRDGFDAACRREQPDAIFLPHRNYRALNREITASECLRGYVRVVERSASPLHVRADLVERYRLCQASGPAH